jgi:hypothetical protein
MGANYELSLRREQKWKFQYNSRNVKQEIEMG